MKNYKNINRLILALLFTLCFSFANAQTTDFSGTWKRNDDKAVFEGITINAIPTILEIKEDAKQISIKRTQVDGAGKSSNYTEVLKSDGSTSETLTPSNLKRTSSLTWSADHSGFTETYSSKDDQGAEKQNGKQTFSISADGKELKIEATQNYGDRSFQITEVFEKQ